jgi:DDE family transposase
LRERSGPIPALKRLVEPAMLGDPTRPLIWVSKSMEKLAATLTQMGHPISADTVRTELVKLGFSRQSTRKADEGSKHPDRNAQFEYINAKAIAAQLGKVVPYPRAGAGPPRGRLSWVLSGYCGTHGQTSDLGTRLPRGDANVVSALKIEPELAGGAKPMS